MMMRANSYLLLPVVATLCNCIFVHFCLPIPYVDGLDEQSSLREYHHRTPPDGHEATNCVLFTIDNNGSISNTEGSQHCRVQLEELKGEDLSEATSSDLHDRYFAQWPSNHDANFTSTAVPSASEAVSDFEDEDDEKDPMLQKIPGMDFEAYVRADIATFYGKEPGTMVERKPRFQGQAGKFVNMSPEPVALYWVGPDGRSPISDIIPAWGSGGTATQPRHEFVLVDPEASSEEDDLLCTVTMQKGTSVYYYDPFRVTSEEDEDDDSFVDDDDDSLDPARCIPPEGTLARDLQELSASDREKYRAHKLNFAFAALYKNVTGGSEWLSMYPRNKPLHKIWRADYFGQEHEVVTLETHFHTDPGAAITEHTLSLQEMRRNYSEPLPLAEYRNSDPLPLTLKAVSCAPRVFEIQNFLSDVEVDHILNLVNKQSLHRSYTGDGSGGHVSSTRTSRNTWLPRHKDMVLNTVFQRAADVLRLDEALLRQRAREELPDFPTKSAINEDLQTVHYDVGQEYTAHHDFSYPIGDHRDSPSRSINLCMYLNDVPAGGETAFPRWRNAETGEAIKVKPEKGKAAVFYMITPDGNLDDLTQHAAMPVLEGVKYFINLWIHDPFRT